MHGVYMCSSVGRPRDIRKIPKSVAGKAQAARGNAAIASADWNSRNSRHPRKSEGKLGEQPSNFEKRGYPTKAICKFVEPICHGSPNRLQWSLVVFLTLDRFQTLSSRIVLCVAVPRPNTAVCTVVPVQGAYDESLTRRHQRLDNIMHAPIIA